MGERLTPPCPICGDPGAYPLWVDKQPPEGCPEGDHIKSITECPWQMGRAKQRAAWRRLVPDAFDESGNMKKGQLGRVLEVWVKENPDAELII